MPAQTEQVSELVGSARALANYTADGFGRRLLAVTDSMKAVLTAFHAGQEIPVHAPPAAMVMSVLDGDGQVRVGNEVSHVRAGDVVTVPAGVARGVLAGPAGLVALHVVSPPPTDADHHRGIVADAWPAAPDPGAAIAAAVSTEHAGLRPSIEALGDLADDVQGLDPTTRQERVDEAVRFLRNELLPHAVAEEAVLYPAAEHVLRARGGAVDTMLIAHRLIAELTDRLEAAGDDTRSLVRLLHEVRAVVLLHLDEEEDVYLPALSGLSEEEAADIAARLGLGTEEHAHV